MRKYRPCRPSRKPAVVPDQPETVRCRPLPEESMSRVLLSGEASLNRHMAAVFSVTGISPVKSSCVVRTDLTAKFNHLRFPASFSRGHNRFVAIKALSANCQRQLAAHLHLLMACIRNSVKVSPVALIDILFMPFPKTGKFSSCKHGSPFRSVSPWASTTLAVTLPVSSPASRSPPGDR